VTEIVKGLGLGLLDPEVLLDSLEAGTIKGLLVVGNPWPVDDLDRVGGAIAKLESAVALLTHDDAVARGAGTVIPITTFAEAEGTYFNALGRLQHFGAAASPIGQARPAWEVLVAMTRAAGAPFRLQSLNELWALLSERVELFEEIHFEELPRDGVALDGETRAPSFKGDKGE